MGTFHPVLRVAALLLTSSVCAAGQVVTLQTDLRPLIKAAANTPVQFAVHVPHTVSAQADGQWAAVTSTSAEWSYSIRIPSAASMSFHATSIRLPSSAVLTVQGAKTTVVYRAQDIKMSDLWSRVLPGESLELKIDVQASQRDQVVLEIQSFQAGYRALSAAAKDHPYYRQLLGQSATGGNASCVQNYQCGVTAANTPIAKATVGVVVGNLYQCTGTLINDVPGDNAPYILTARHCESGTYGGGVPGNSVNVTVYWNATTPCGSTLGSIYDPGIVTQSGSTTMVEQQDVWLIKLLNSPAASDAQFAGFDASGAAVQGGYTIHHALGANDQLTRWFGRALALQQTGVLGSAFVSNFLETVNQAGNIGPGASGSGLVDGNNRVVGALSLGRKTTDASGYESCPVTSPGAPNGSNGSADFTALAAVWNSTADRTASTGTATLKSVLDPANSGTKVVSSTPALSLNFAASSYSLTDGDMLTLSWNVPGATACTATGGANGDGWPASLPAAGSTTLTETFGGPVKYSLTCAFSGNRHVTTSVLVNWYGTVPFVTLDASTIRWIGANAAITWSSNVSPCSITGGDLSLSGLPSSGTVSTTQDNVGDVTYTMSCGTSPVATGRTTVSYIAPALVFRANGTDRMLGQDLHLYWQSYADTCIPSGGTTDDGWTTGVLGPANDFEPMVAVVGTYTYTLTCSAGPSQVSQSVTVTVENDAPYTSLSIVPTTVTYSASPADYVTISWKSNLSNCTLNSTPVNLIAQFTTYPLLPSGAADVEDSGPYAPGGPGDYVVSMTCTNPIGPQNPVTSTPITVHVLPPPAPTATISTTSSVLLVGQQFTINWSSTNTVGCVQTGNGQGVGVIWGGSVIQPNGSQAASTNATGQVVLGMTCNSIDPNQAPVSAQTAITVNGTVPPTATLTLNRTMATVGDSFTVGWSSEHADTCNASGGGANGSPWTGSVGPSGIVSQTATVSGSFTYVVTCLEGSASVKSQSTITVSAPAGSGGASSNKGGGGSSGLAELFAMLALLAMSSKRERFRAVPPR
ncbi:MAG TPA: hypothetical protein VK652_09105 [Steroidobacteraceae bacterium]|nr:hypothetical protein [Steroidobacteraceae bacterium]